MEVEGLVGIIGNYGLCGAITAYFLVRDWKFNTNLIQTMTTLTETVSALKDTVKMLHKVE